MISPEILVPVCSLLSAVSVKIIDVIHLRMVEKRQRKAGELTLNEKIDKIIADQNEMKEQIRLSSEVTLATARDRIYYLCKRYADENRFDAHDLEDIEELYEPYKAAGGNGLAKELFDTYKEQFRKYNKSHI